MKPTPIFIYDKDENLKLVFEPKQHTSIIPADSGQTQLASMFIGDDGDQQFPRIERPLLYTNPKFVEELNGRETLEFEVPYKPDDEEVEWIMEDGRAVIRDLDGNLVEFIIREIHDENSMNGTVKRVICESSEYELNDEWLTGYNVSTVTLRTALGAVLQGTRFEVGDIGDFGHENVNLGPMSVKRAVTELLEQFGGEKRVRVEKQGNRIVRRYIDILTNRGEVTGKRFEYGKDIQNVRREVDATGIKTALYGLGESTENDGPRVTFAEIVWSEAAGDPIDKPLGQQWVGDPEALELYGYRDGDNLRHRFGTNDSQEADPGQLLLETWRTLQEINKPRLTYEMDVVVLEHLTGRDHEKVRLGDTVFIIDKSMKPELKVEASVIRFEHNLLEPSRSNVILGNFRDSYFADSERLREVERTVGDRQGNWDYKETPEGAWQKAQDALQEARVEIEAAELRIDDAEQAISQAESDITDAQTIIDSVTDVDEDGLHVLSGTLVTNEIIAENAVLTGTITAPNATIVDLTVEDITAIGGTFQNITITGTLTSIDGTFTGDIVTGKDAYVGNNLYVGEPSSGDPKRVTFTNLAYIEGVSTSLFAKANYLQLDTTNVRLVGSIEVDNNVSADVVSTSSIEGPLSNRNQISLGTSGPSVDMTGGTARWRRTVSDYIMQTDDYVAFIFGGSQVHRFDDDGTKSGGSIVDPETGKRWGMSPIDSPQILLEDVIFHKNVNGETEIKLDDKFSRVISMYDVWPTNPNIDMVKKEKDRFTVKGRGISSFRIIGKRYGSEKRYWTNLNVSEEEEKWT